MGKMIILVGTAGDGQVCNVANQTIVALNIAAVGEGLLFASRAGADPAKVRQALRTCRSARSCQIPASLSLPSRHRMVALR